MIKQTLRSALQSLGFDLVSIPKSFRNGATRGPIPVQPAAVQPIWPLPRKAGGPSDAEIRSRFGAFDSWHYGFHFEGGLSFSPRHKKFHYLSDAPERTLQRFHHFMPYLVAAAGGSLKGKRLLDIACNSGFWAIQYALLGADVVAFDARDELIEQSNLVKSIVGVENVEFRKLDFWDMTPETLGGQFDIVCNVGILYHLSKPLEALERTRAMTRGTMLVDTEIYPARTPIVRLKWEHNSDVHFAAKSGIVANSSRSAIEMMLRQLGCKDWFEVPVRSRDLPGDYLEDRRTTWILRV